MKPKDVLDLAKQAGAVMVDLRFIDLPGVWQHTSYASSTRSPSMSPPSAMVGRIAKITSNAGKQKRMVFLRSIRASFTSCRKSVAAPTRSLSTTHG